MTVLSLQIVYVTSWAWSNLRTSGQTQLGPLILRSTKGSRFPIALGRLLDQALNFGCLFVWWVCKMLRLWDTINAQCWKWGQASTQCWLMSSLQNCFCRHKSLSDFCGNWLMLIAWFLFWMILYCHMLVLCWYLPEDEVGDFHYWKTCHLSHLFQILIYWSRFSFWRYRALCVIMHWFAKIMWITVWLNIFLKKKI